MNLLIRRLLWINNRVFLSSLRTNNGPRYGQQENFKQDPNKINGLSEYVLNLRENFPLAESDVLALGHSSDPGMTVLNFKDFQPGSVVAIRYVHKTSLNKYCNIFA